MDMHNSGDRLPDFGEAVDDPNHFHETLRERCPVYQLAGFDHPIHLVSRHQDVFAMLRDPKVWSNSSGNTPRYIEQLGLRGDPPESTLLRRLVVPVFNARRIKALEDRALETCHRTIDGFVGRGRAEISGDYASVLPMDLMSDLLGVESERREEFEEWTAEWLHSLETNDAVAEERSRTKAFDYFAGKLERRREELAATPDETPYDALGIFATAEHPDGRPFSHEEILPLTLLLLSGGTDTTKYLITNCVYRLLERRDRWEQVCANLDLVDVAIEETLRYDPPVAGVFRMNLSDTTVSGTEIPEGSKVQCVIGAANRDPAVFEGPDSFRLDRDLKYLRNNHLAFGFGTHFCVGAALGRMGARAAIRTLAERLPQLRMAEAAPVAKPYVVPSTIPIGLIELHVTWPTSNPS